MLYVGAYLYSYIGFILIIKASTTRLLVYNIRLYYDTNIAHVVGKSIQRDGLQNVNYFWIIRHGY